MLRIGEAYWHCTNRDCGMTTACDETESGLEWRVCDCGSLMKKQAQSTVFSYLNFLWDEARSVSEETNEKEETPCEN